MKPTKSGRITWKRFCRDFPLIKNHMDDNAAYDGCMFETFGKELDYVVSMINQDRVLTITDCDGKSIIGPGYHYINRIGYLITEKPVTIDFWVRD